LEKITEVIEQCFVGVCCHEKRWSSFVAATENLWVVQRSCGEWRVLGGGGARLCL